MGPLPPSEKLRPLDSQAHLYQSSLMTNHDSGLKLLANVTEGIKWFYIKQRIRSYLNQIRF